MVVCSISVEEQCYELIRGDDAIVDRLKSQLINEISEF